MKVLQIAAIALMLANCSSAKKDSTSEAAEKKHNPREKEVPFPEKYYAAHPDLPKARILKRDEIAISAASDFDYIHPISEVIWTPAEEAKSVRLNDDVSAFELNDTFYVLPWYVMKNHHVANLTIQGTDMVLTLCEVCAGSSAFSPIIDGRKLTFKLGGIYNGNNCMTDEDGDVWGTFTGEALTGPYKGQKLRRYQMYQTTWQDWIAANLGNTLVADYSDSLRVGHGHNVRPGFKWMGFSETLERPTDSRLKDNLMIQGVIIGTDSRAYPHRIIKRKTLIQDDLAGRKIVLFSEPGSTIISCFDRELDGRQLSFKMEGDKIVDTETSSDWKINGRAIAGPLKGKELTYVPNYPEEWYAWSAYHPDTSIFGIK